MANFTAAQQSAIDEQSKTLLVSAAAGSGKTTTLIERIIRSVTRKENPVMLDRLLVVTFTKATASELRLKISKAVSEAIANDGENETLAKQFALLQSAKISTIDSFCLDMVRQNYMTLGLPPSFRMADEGESTLLAHETMNELINECYDNPESTLCGGANGFAKLVDLIIGAADDHSLADTLLSLYTKLSAFPKGASALYDCASDLREYSKHDFFDCPHGKRIEKHLLDVFEYYRRGYLYCIERIALDEKLSKAYANVFEEDLHNIFTVEKALKEGYTAGREAINAIVFNKLGTLRGDKSDDALFVKAFRDDFKETVKENISTYVSASGKNVAAALIKTADICEMLGDFLVEYEKRAENEKKRLGICDFSDLSRYALRLLVDKNGNDTPFALAQKELYDAVYIDEYQDVNAVQDRIFDAVSTKTNRFMVGDIKQSIYGFRGAEPAIFANLRNVYPPYEKDKEGDCATIFMSENFRCNKEVINFTNMIFDSVMPLISPDMNYKQSDSLVFKKKCEKESSTPVKVVIAESPSKNSQNYGENTEAHYIAREIRRLVNEETKDDGSPITYGDIAILMRSPKARVDTFSKVFRAYGIPVFTETNENLLNQSEVEIILCLLDVIDNPRRDISLTGALLSPLYNVSCDFLASVRRGVRDERLFTTLKKFAASDCESEEKNVIASFIKELSELRSMARFMNAGELIDELYSRRAIYARLSASSPLRRANLEKLRHVAYNFSGAVPRSLSEFLRYIKNVEQNAKNPIPAATVAEDSQNAITIRSIHKSKGLEFPVVFFSDTQKRYNTDDVKSAILYSGNLGFAMKLRDETGFGLYNPLLRKSLSLAIVNSLKEEQLRLMYVALTRARERLYVTAMTSKPRELIATAKGESNFVTKYSAEKQSSFLPLILLAAKGEESAVHTIEIVEDGPLFNKETAVSNIEIDEVDVDEEAVAALNARFDFHYEHTARTKIPAKLAISRLYPDILDDTVLSDTIEQKKLPRPMDAPRFIAASADETAAKRGTATHLFMQFFDFENAAQNGAAAELARLVEKHFLTESDAALVNLDEVEMFLKSDLFAKMHSATTIYREQRFNLTLDACDFAKDEGLKAELSGETVLVQGVIDCFFYDQNGDIILVDYKTDRVSKNDRRAAEEKLRAAHSAQLSYYAKAVEEMCEMYPTKVLVYSLCLGDTVEM